MKNTLSILVILLCVWGFVPVRAGVTTYTFTSAQWASKVDATACDGVSDGWLCDKAATDYSAGRTAADGSIYSRGVDVKTGTSGAGATSVQSFSEVRRITVNFCQNSSKGRGTITVQVGDNDAYSIRINKPESGKGEFNRDSVIILSAPESGKISFRVECTENAIYINSISIRSAAGGSSIFTTDSYRLVTDAEQLQDSDQVIIGVYKEGVNYIMGYYDEWESVNNIHAIRGRYSDDRMTVDADDRAIYTLRITELDGKKAYVLQDELRYEEAYLVASGGRTKNRLALWTDVTDERTYGNYGYWDILIENGGEAVITNKGNSLAKIIQYNAQNNPTLFACYQDRSQTPVCLYRRVEAMGDVAAIVAPMVNFGTTLELSGQRTIQVNANRLTEDITVTHSNADIFSFGEWDDDPSAPVVLDRDGDELTVYYRINVPACQDCDFDPAGHYTDTIVFTSGNVQTQVLVMLHVERKRNIDEAVQAVDNATVYLNDVVVTKKFDNYIYVRDSTGSMLLFDRGDGETGKRYGAKLNTSGDVLSGVVGRFTNYFGVPEISPTEAFRIGENVEVEPEPAGARIDSADVCKYMVLDSAVVDSWTCLTYRGQTYAVDNKFNLPSYVKDVPTRTYVMVSYDRDVVTLYIVRQDTYPEIPDMLDETKVESGARVMLIDGRLLIILKDAIYTPAGVRL